MCNYTYHHDPNCGHIASFNITTCPSFTSSLRLPESEHQPAHCTNTVYTHDLVHPLQPSLCAQCENEWTERARKRVRAMAVGEALLEESEEEVGNEERGFVQLEGLECPPKVGMMFICTAPKGKGREKLIGEGTMDDGVQSYYDYDYDSDSDSDVHVDVESDGASADAGFNTYKSDYEDAHEHSDEDGESCRANSPFVSSGPSPSPSPSPSFFEQRQYFDINYKDTPTPGEYIHISAIDDELSSDDDIELVYLDYPRSTSELGKYLHELDSDSDSHSNGAESIEFYDLSPASSYPERSFLDVEESGGEESVSLVSGTPRSPRTVEFKEREVIAGNMVPVVTRFLGRVYNGLPGILLWVLG